MGQACSVAVCVTVGDGAPVCVCVEVRQGLKRSLLHCATGKMDVGMYVAVLIHDSS